MTTIPAPSDAVQIFLTARDTSARLTAQPPVPFTALPSASLPSVMVDDRVKYQAIEGFGGAFTEAAAVTFYKMPKEAQDQILKAYFDPAQGHGYTLCRTHINSCDFSLGNYAYVETPGDTELKTFSLERDRRSLIPMIKAATQTAGGALKLFASPWSPPAWMKTTGMMNRGGQLRPECRDAWARYYCRYIREYQREGIPIWGLTVQNEPEASQSWDSCLYSGAEERDFVRDHLGPALAREGLGQVRLMIWDHNRDRMFERAKAVFDDPSAAQYVWGTAFHWYVADCFENVQRVHDAWPGKQLLFSEGCQEGGPHLGEWEMGERYARSMINDLNRWTVGWVDWNLVLDQTGGPNHVNNLCSAPLIADTTSGQVLYQSSYWYIGHFSRFIRPGARRVLCAATRDELEATAAQNPDGSMAIVVLNRSAKPIEFAIKQRCQGAVVTIPARAILTVVCRN